MIRLKDKIRTCDKPVNFIRVRRWVAGTIIGVMFGGLGTLTWAVVELHDLQAEHETQQEFDDRRAYDVCVGSNIQIGAVVEKLIVPTPIREDMTSAERLSAEAANSRIDQRREGIRNTITEVRRECDKYLR